MLCFGSTAKGAQPSARLGPSRHFWQGAQTHELLDYCTACISGLAAVAVVVVVVVIVVQLVLLVLQTTLALAL